MLALRLVTFAAAAARDLGDHKGRLARVRAVRRARIVDRPPPGRGRQHSQAMHHGASQIFFRYPAMGIFVKPKPS